MGIKNIGFYTVDLDYVKTLYKVDSEVFYDNSKNYEKKPYVGIITTCKNFKYFIPLTSAKQKHLNWKNVSETNYIIYEHIKLTDLPENDDNCVYKIINSDMSKEYQYVKHILAVLEIKKMLPVPEGTYHFVNFSDIEDEDYRSLLIKEYNFIRPMSSKIIDKANNLYNEQITTQKIRQFGCDFLKLEKVCVSYNNTTE